MHTPVCLVSAEQRQRTELAQSGHELSHKSENRNELKKKNEQTRQTDRPTFGKKTWDINGRMEARSGGEAGVSVPGLQQLQSRATGQEVAERINALHHARAGSVPVACGLRPAWEKQVI